MGFSMTDLGSVVVTSADSKCGLISKRTPVSVAGVLATDSTAGAASQRTYSTVADGSSVTTVG